jgi:hypothetical protein
LASAEDKLMKDMSEIHVIGSGALALRAPVFKHINAQNGALHAESKLLNEHQQHIEILNTLYLNNFREEVTKTLKY